MPRCRDHGSYAGREDAPCPACERQATRSALAQPRTSSGHGSSHSSRHGSTPYHRPSAAAGSSLTAPPEFVAAVQNAFTRSMNFKGFGERPPHYSVHYARDTAEAAFKMGYSSGPSQSVLDMAKLPSDFVEGIAKAVWSNNPSVRTLLTDSAQNRELNLRPWVTVATSRPLCGWQSRDQGRTIRAGTFRRMALSKVGRALRDEPCAGAISHRTTFAWIEGHPEIFTPDHGSSSSRGTSSSRR
jgi:hypothetical protein